MSNKEIDKADTDQKIIGLLGLAFGSTNKGCEALGYGFLSILQKVAMRAQTKFELHIFERCNTEEIYGNGDFSRLILKSIPIPGVGTVAHIKEHFHNFKKCDIVFDFTAGDSFSDIYGLKRFVLRSIIKEIAIVSKTPFVLGSQTYGPYNSKIAKIMAGHIMNNSLAVYARDEKSCDVVSAVSKCCAKRTVDVAFAMEYEKQTINSDKIKIGFNPSGLLWRGGYTQSNQFGLILDYQEYCRKMLTYLLKEEKYEVYLIAHVLSHNMNEIDNDIIACDSLKNEFPEVIDTPFFMTPVDAKSYISGMDVFIGARMHATIAAFTTGVPVVPFSYSPKFEGLFATLGYNHVVSATQIGTQEAIDFTIELINQREKLKEELAELETKVKDGVNYLVDEMERLLC